MRQLTFSSKILKIGINPYVPLPKHVLTALFRQAGKTKGPIPERGTLNGKAFIQTLVRYRGAWRLYLNTYMRQAAWIDVGDEAHVEIAFDPRPRVEPMNRRLALALAGNKAAKDAFAALAPSRQKEIQRYLNSMKTSESVARNVEKVVQHLLGRKPQGLRAVLRQ
ncbi:MAG: DUF1905 domain-containing protein [bacterium]